MLPRLLTLAIFGFWLTMSGILMRSIWFPADSQLAEVNPGAVFQLIAARGEASALDIYDDRKIVGNLSVLAEPVANGSKARTRLKVNGRLNPDTGWMAGTIIDLNSRTELDHGGETQSFQFTLSAVQPKLQLSLTQASPEAGPVLVLSKAGVVLVNTAGMGAESLEANPMVALLLGTLGMSWTDFQSLRTQAEAAAGDTKVEARQGKFDLAGSPRQGFILRIGTPGKPGFRVCVENTGEIVSLETPVSYHLMAESVRPTSDPAP